MIALGRAEVRMLNGDGARRCFCHSGSGENFLQFAGADDRVHFRNVLADLVVKTLDQATGDHQSLRLAAGFVAGHFEDRIDRFLLRAADKRAGIHHDDVGVRRRWE